MKINTGADASAKVPAAGTLVMRQLYAAPHGKQSFAAVNVTLNGDTIVSAKIDEFQYVKRVPIGLVSRIQTRTLARVILKASF